MNSFNQFKSLAPILASKLSVESKKILGILAVSDTSERFNQYLKDHNLEAVSTLQDIGTIDSEAATMFNEIIQESWIESFSNELTEDQESVITAVIDKEEDLDSEMFKSIVNRLGAKIAVAKEFGKKQLEKKAKDRDLRILINKYAEDADVEGLGYDKKLEYILWNLQDRGYSVTKDEIIDILGEDQTVTASIETSDRVTTPDGYGKVVTIDDLGIKVWVPSQGEKYYKKEELEKLGSLTKEAWSTFETGDRVNTPDGPGEVISFGNGHYQIALDEGVDREFSFEELSPDLENPVREKNDYGQAFEPSNTQSQYEVKTGLKRVCSWCGKDMGEKEPLEDERTTHTICDDCAKGMFSDDDDEPITKQAIVFQLGDKRLTPEERKSIFNDIKAEATNKGLVLAGASMWNTDNNSLNLDLITKAQAESFGGRTISTEDLDSEFKKKVIARIETTGATVWNSDKILNKGVVEVVDSFLSAEDARKLANAVKRDYAFQFTRVVSGEIPLDDEGSFLKVNVTAPEDTKYQLVKKQVSEETKNELKPYKEALVSNHINVAQETKSDWWNKLTDKQKADYKAKHKNTKKASFHSNLIEAFRKNPHLDQADRALLLEATTPEEIYDSLKKTSVWQRPLLAIQFLRDLQGMEKEAISSIERENQKPIFGEDYKYSEKCEECGTELDQWGVCPKCNYEEHEKMKIATEDIKIGHYTIKHVGNAWQIWDSKGKVEDYAEKENAIGAAKSMLQSKTAGFKPFNELQEEFNELKKLEINDKIDPAKVNTLIEEINNARANAPSQADYSELVDLKRKVEEEFRQFLNKNATIRTDEEVMKLAKEKGIDITSKVEFKSKYDSKTPTWTGKVTNYSKGKVEVVRDSDGEVMYEEIEELTPVDTTTLEKLESFRTLVSKAMIKEAYLTDFQLTNLDSGLDALSVAVLAMGEPELMMTFQALKFTLNSIKDSRQHAIERDEYRNRAIMTGASKKEATYLKFTYSTETFWEAEDKNRDETIRNIGTINQAIKLYNDDAITEALKNPGQWVKVASKPVTIETKQVEESNWICPHCKQVIHEKSLYNDGTNWYHRPCIEKGAIELPKDKITAAFTKRCQEEGDVYMYVYMNVNQPARVIWTSDKEVSLKWVGRGSYDEGFVVVPKEDLKDTSKWVKKAIKVESIPERGIEEAIPYLQDNPKETEEWEKIKKRKLPNGDYELTTDERLEDFGNWSKGRFSEASTKEALKLNDLQIGDRVKRISPFTGEVEEGEVYSFNALYNDRVDIFFDGADDSIEVPIKELKKISSIKLASFNAEKTVKEGLEMGLTKDELIIQVLDDARYEGVTLTEEQAKQAVEEAMKNLNNLGKVVPQDTEGLEETTM